MKSFMRFAKICQNYNGKVGVTFTSLNKKSSNCSRYFLTTLQILGLDLKISKDLGLQIFYMLRLTVRMCQHQITLILFFLNRPWCFCTMLLWYHYVMCSRLPRPKGTTIHLLRNQYIVVRGKEGLDLKNKQPCTLINFPSCKSLLFLSMCYLFIRLIPVKQKCRLL